MEAVNQQIFRIILPYYLHRYFSPVEYHDVLCTVVMHGAQSVCTLNDKLFHTACRLICINSEYHA